MLMILSLAPMEGITGHVFRRVHAECFGALDCYYTPFLPPPRVGNRFGGKALKEIDPANNQGLNVVPQLMSKNADEFVWRRKCLPTWATARSISTLAALGDGCCQGQRIGLFAQLGRA